MASNFKLDVDGDGIALIAWDMPGHSMNLIDLATIKELSHDRGEGRRRRRGQGRGRSLRPRRRSCAGADLTLLESLSRALRRSSAQEQGRGGRSPPCCSIESRELSQALPAPGDLRQAVRRCDQRHRARRRLRTCLACHHRVAARQRQDPPRSARGRRSACSPAPAARSASRA